MNDKKRYQVNNQAVSYQCPICGDWVPLKEDKNGKPYGTCWSCGFQFFFRQDKAIQTLKDSVEAGSKQFKTEEV